MLLPLYMHCNTCQKHSVYYQTLCLGEMLGFKCENSKQSKRAQAESGRKQFICVRQAVIAALSHTEIGYMDAV